MGGKRKERVPKQNNRLQPHIYGGNQGGQKNKNRAGGSRGKQGRVGRGQFQRNFRQKHGGLEKNEAP